MSLKKLFRILLGIQCVLGIGLGVLTITLFVNQDELVRSQHVHFRPYLLADELRQSSDDLTRLARTYVATGNEEFERQYWAVLDIRNGKSPRPVDYNRIYWDFFAETGRKPRPDGAAISLRELMIKEGFTDAEFEKLSLSQRHSDELVKTEKIAMNAVKGLFDDGAGNFTVKREPDRVWAIKLMNDEAYHKNKSGIMKPIDDFFAMFAERTAGDVAKYERRSMMLLQSLVVLIIVIMGMFGYSFVKIQRQIARNEQAEERLKEERNLLSTLITAIPDEVAVKDLERRFVLVNPPCVRALGKDSAADVLGRRDEDLISREFAEVNIREEEQVLSTGKPVLNIERAGRPDPITGEIVRVILTSKSPIRDEHGAVTGLVVVNRDITLRKRAETQRDLALEVVRKSENRLRDIIFSLGDWVWETDENGVYTYSSQKGFDLFGPSRDEVIGKTPFAFMPPEEQERMAAIFSEIVANKAPIKDLENWNIGKSGERICLLTNGVPILSAEGDLKGYRGVDKDITERKQAEDQLRRSLEEKEVLLREVHHRVKNNLNVISSLLSLQSSSIKTPEQALVAFRNSRDRIVAMALVHKELYESENYARVDMSEYLENLTRHVLKAYGSGGNIRLSVEAEGITLSVNTSIPCGLILNELITNAFKHAYPNGRTGEIRVRFAAADDESFELSVSDDGIGLPESYGGGGTLGDRLSNSFQHLNYRPHLFVYLWERTSCPTEYPSDEQDIPYV